MGIRDTELTTLMKHLQYLGTDRDLAGGQVIEGVSGERTGRGGGPASTDSCDGDVHCAFLMKPKIMPA